MQHAKRFLSEHKHFGLLLVFILLAVWFEYCEKNIPARYIMHTTIDEKIPFVKEFVVPYIVWYFYQVFGLIYIGLNSKKNFYKLIIFMVGGMAVSYIIFMIFPSGQDLRPVITQDDIFSKTIKYLYFIDTPTNVCPSIHVFNSIAVYSALKNSAAFNAKKWCRNISFITMVSICLSTMFIKQHSVIDFICGIALAALFYIPLYFIPNVKQQNLSYEKI